MTYSLHTLNHTKDPAPPPVSGWQRFVQEIALYLGFVVLLYWLVAMLSHSAQDPAWTTSGSSLTPRNWGGRIGAAISDLGFFLAGYSIVWCFLAATIAWLRALAVRKWAWLTMGRRAMLKLPGFFTIWATAWKRGT